MELDLAKLNVIELLNARDDAIKARGDLQRFYHERFTRSLGATIGNPADLPIIINKYRTDMVSHLVRLIGKHAEASIEDFTTLIDRISEELVDRTGRSG